MILTHQVSGSVRSCPVRSVASLCVAASPLFQRLLLHGMPGPLSESLRIPGYLAAFPWGNPEIKPGCLTGMPFCGSSCFERCSFLSWKICSLFLLFLPAFQDLFSESKQENKTGGCVSFPQNKKPVTIFLNRSPEFIHGTCL